jgi:hypothetical protein
MTFAADSSQITRFILLLPITHETDDQHYSSSTFY